MFFQRMFGLLILSLAILTCACSSSPTAPNEPLLKVTSIVPAIGSTTGGTMVTVSGTGFPTNASLSVGGVTAQQITVSSPSTLTATLGPHPSAGTVDAVVTIGSANAVLRSAFTFVAPNAGTVPPAVVSVTIRGPRQNQPQGFANQGDVVLITPVIDHVDTSLVDYSWTGAGIFVTDSGVTSWQLPPQVSPTPSALTSSLVVTKSFSENGTTHHLSSPPFAVTVNAHDSEKEVLDMGEDFLTLFTKQFSSEQVLHNFSRTCDGGRGRDDEAGDGAKNRADLIEDFNAFRIARRPGFAIRFKSFCSAGTKPAQLNTDACASFSVHWEGIERKSSSRFVTDGIDYVSAVFEDDRWKLCHSSFVGTESFPSLGITREVSW